MRWDGKGSNRGVKAAENAFLSVKILALRARLWVTPKRG